MTNLEDIIRRGQDRLRGRPRNWRDDLSDWWCRFSFRELFWAAYATLMFIYVGSVAAFLFALAWHLWKAS